MSLPYASCGDINVNKTNEVSCLMEPTVYQGRRALLLQILIHYRFHKCHESKKGKEVGTVRTYDEGTSCSLGGVQRWASLRIFPPLCSQHFALRTSLVLLQLSYHYFHHFFSSNPTPHQVLSSSRSRISPHCSSHCPSPA